MVRVGQIRLNQTVSKKVSVRKAAKNKPTKLRASITPGTICIPLTGQFRGKKVVALKQMEKSGLVLVSGPFKVNGVPLRRMNQRYLIATSTKLSLGSMDLAKFTDEYFKKEAAPAKKGEEAFFDKSVKPELKAERKADQAAVDKTILAAIGKDTMMKKYLQSRFALSNNQDAHTLKF